MPTFNLAAPDRGASKAVRAKAKSVQFGDGYSQNVKDGINNIVEDWNLSFTLRTRELIKSIDDQLRAWGGAVLFTWTTPEGNTFKFRCKEWSAVYNHDTDCSLSCKFEQGFGL